MDSWWLAIFGTGGVLGFFLRPTIERFLTSLYRPRLVIEFPGAEPGCELQTRVQATETPTQNYLRIRIRNRGRTTAHNVSVYGTALGIGCAGPKKGTLILNSAKKSSI